MTIQARLSLQEALDSRREGIGRICLPVAAVLEEMGKLELEEGNFKESFAHFKECLDILKQHHA